MKKTYGGVLGRNLKHKAKIRKFALAVIAVLFVMVTSTSVDSYSHGKEINKAGIGYAAGLGAVLFFRDPGTGSSGGPDPEKEKELLEKVKKTAKDLLEEFKTASAAERKTMADEIKTLTDQLKTMEASFKASEGFKYKEMTEEVQRLAGELKALQENPQADKKFKSFNEALEDAYKEAKPEIDKILKNGGRQEGPLHIVIKVPVTMQTDNTIGAVGSASHYSLTSNTGIISTLRKRLLTYLQNVSVGGLSVDRPYAMWIEELDEQGTPIFIGEGDDKTQLSVRYEEREAKAKKIAVYGKITTEMLRYLPQLTSYINNNLLKRMDIKTEDQLFNGDNVGDNLKGILSYATAFDGGVGVAAEPGLVGAVEDPNIYDVLRALVLQVQNSYGDASGVWVSFSTLANMDVEKDSEGRYLLPPFRTADGTIVAGVKLIGTNALAGTDYDFVGGDLSVVHVEFLYQLGLQIGLDGNDFTKNKKTILAEQELVQFVSANDTQVLVKGDFETAKALLLEV